MNNFYAYLSRMKYIERWSLMHSSKKENIMEHSEQVAILAHALATIKNVYFKGNINTDRIATLAIFHDASEVITGDLPTPVKYYNAELRDAYKGLESIACNKLLDMLPAPLKDLYAPLFFTSSDSEEYQIIKAADKLAAYIKCLEELNFGNKEFSKAKLAIEKDLKSYALPELDFFMDNFVPSYKKTLDELD